MLRLGRAFPVLAALLVTLVTPSARGDVSFAPASDGHLGAWLIAGPLPADWPLPDVATLRLAVPERLPGRLEWLSWASTDGGTGALDLDHALGTTKGNRALLAGVLTLEEPLDGWLLVSADGSVSVSADGKPIWSRSSAHPRGAAWDAVPLALAAGAHALVFDLTRRTPAWSFEARLLTRADLAPPRGARWTLPGVPTKDAARFASHLARVEARSGVIPYGYQPRVEIDFPRGAPVDAAVRVTATPFSQGSALGAPLALGGLPIEPRGVARLDAPLPAVSTATLHDAAARRLDEIRVQIGDAERRVALPLTAAASDAVSRALALRDVLRRGRDFPLSDREVVIATLETAVSELGILLDRGDPASGARAERLVALVDRVESGRDPLHEPGILDIARRSSLDGATDPLRLHVPAGYSHGTSQRYPLVVVLHGYNGNPERVMNAFLGTESLRPHPRVDGFVLAPHAHGDAFYRGPGEAELLDTIDWALRTYPIDPERVSVTGISMGGTGAAHLAFRHPDRFASAAALAGYQSYFVRRDVRGRRLRDWEWTELSRWSPASFADNGRDLFLYVAQGTRDLPLEHSRVLADRYRALGYPFRDDWPDIGHDVWRIAWGDAKLWPVLAGRRRVAVPAHVTLKTDSLRYGSRAWATVTALAHRGTPASLDAVVETPARIVVRTRGVEAFELRRPSPRVADAAAVTLVVDGQTLALDAGAAMALHRDEERWTTGPLPPPKSGRVKRPGVEGPIRDAFFGPLAFVYGTLDPAESAATREVAEHFRGRWSGSTQFPLVADVAVTPELMETHSLFIVGSRTSNAVVRDLDALLPLGIDGSRVRFGDQLVTGDPELGFACIFPNPKAKDRYVVTLEAVNARGLYRSMALPMQLPDFIVFDSALAPAAGQQVLGGARVLGAGYFDRSWALPPALADVIAMPPGRDPSTWTPPASASERRTPAAGAGAPRP